MDASRREQILRTYSNHTRRFDEIAARSLRSTGLFVECETPTDPVCEPPAPRHRDLLSGRELEVLSLLAWGYSNQEISSKLRITLETVKSHVHHILGRLNAHNRAHAVGLGYEHGLLVSGPARQRG